MKTALIILGIIAVITILLIVVGTCMCAKWGDITIGAMNQTHEEL